jgi:hypothetical protein
MPNKLGLLASAAAAFLTGAAAVLVFHQPTLAFVSWTRPLTLLCSTIS